MLIGVFALAALAATAWLEHLLPSEEAPADPAGEPSGMGPR
jgi:hypothetical protein